MFSKLFWKDAAERVFSTAAQTALGVLVAGSITDLGTKVGIVTILTAAAASLLKSIVAVAAVDDTVSPASLVKE